VSVHFSQTLHNLDSQGCCWYHYFSSTCVVCTSPVSVSRRQCTALHGVIADKLY